MVTLQFGAIKISYNISRIKPYKYDTNIEDITTEEYLWYGLTLLEV